MTKGVEHPGGGRIEDKREPPAADLVTVQHAHGGGPLQVHRLALAAWTQMRAAWVASGGDPSLLGIMSGWRSIATQTEKFADAVAKYGSESAAAKYVARPGGSAHHSGRAIDLDLDGRGTIDSAAIPRLRQTPAAVWLANHAVKFGFYPYSKEPWHWEWNPPG